MKIDFYLYFRTSFGQSIYIILKKWKEDDPEGSIVPMKFLNEELWHVQVDLDEKSSFHYQYQFQNEKGERIKDAEKDRIIYPEKLATEHLILIDTWNDARFYENAFYTAPFNEVFTRKRKRLKINKSETYTHCFKVKAPLLKEDECVCIVGGAEELKNWKSEAPVLLSKNGEWWETKSDLLKSEFPLAYKYGIYNEKKETFVHFEEGDNRILFAKGDENTKTIVHDGFLRKKNNHWRGAGVAIPVFSLKSKNSFGIGEFTDIKLLVDWAAETGIKLIQLLPVNDTTATFGCKDSYPYAAISAFALNPVYINLQKVAGKKFDRITKSISKKQKQLNALQEIDYVQVLRFKISILQELYEMHKEEFFRDEEFNAFFEDNAYWLKPYAAFCHFRDKYGTSEYEKWRTNAIYNEEEIENLTSKKSRHYHKIAFYYFVQYHLHLQLKNATEYAHRKGVAVKGDIPIGIYRNGCDAWMSPHLYNMLEQAGAPPDDFAIKGQNWGFPTYNWKQMEEDHFEWWRKRFHQMSYYFDAFRIDHILGFFRIWSIPISAVEGVLGIFKPAIPLDIKEFGEAGIWFDYERFCKPFITEEIIHQNFGEHSVFVKEHFLDFDGDRYSLKENYNTQRKVFEFFTSQDDTEENKKICAGLFDLISNVILIEEEASNKTKFHFRILIEHTSSFKALDPHTQHKLKELYVNYFYQRQDEFWKHEALRKLPALKEATNMLICGEDLGMVPHCVPEVMQQLGILSLEIQRMPKNSATEFFHPKDAPYLSVITPSTHDMSTLRGWWEENREKTQRFYNTILDESGEAPYFCEPWINRAIVLQHLYSPSMWSIFQLQDLLGMSETLRREDPAEERINNPADPNHYWNYRMHISLEDLLKEKEFNNELSGYIENSGR